MMNINDYITDLCIKHGTYIYNSIDINTYISYLGKIYGSYIFHPIEEDRVWVKKKRI